MGVNGLNSKHVYWIHEDYRNIVPTEITNLASIRVCPIKFLLVQKVDDDPLSRLEWSFHIWVVRDDDTKILNVIIKEGLEELDSLLTKEHSIVYESAGKVGYTLLYTHPEIFEEYIRKNFKDYVDMIKAIEQQENLFTIDLTTGLGLHYRLASSRTYRMILNILCPADPILPYSKMYSQARQGTSAEMVIR